MSFINNAFHPVNQVNILSRYNTNIDFDNVCSSSEENYVNDYFFNTNLPNDDFNSETKKTSIKPVVPVPKVISNLEPVGQLNTKYFQQLDKSRPEFPAKNILMLILPMLDSLGLTMLEYSWMEYFVNCNKRDVERERKTIHIKRGTYQIARSIVYIPSGQQKGWHILLKTHGGVKEVGEGRDNRVTKTLHLNSGTIRAFRSANALCITRLEIFVNGLFGKNIPDLCATGSIVVYEGPCSPRNKNVKKIGNGCQNLPKLTINKIALVMDYFVNGDLNSQVDNLNSPQKVYIMSKVALGLAEMHRLGYTHRDVKSTNILLDENFNPKIADFGLVCKSGSLCEPVSTSGHESPELLLAKIENKSVYFVDPNTDCWSFGITLLSIFTDNVWYGEWPKISSDPSIQMDRLYDLISRVCAKIFEQPNCNQHMIQVVEVIMRSFSFDTYYRMPSLVASQNLLDIYNTMSM